MKRKTIKSVSKLLLLVVTALLIASPVIPQKSQKPEQKIFSPVPSKTRQRLIERLNLLIESQSKGDWSAVYDMLFGADLERVSKEDFIIAASNYDGLKILNFTPLFVSRRGREGVKGAQWLIAGQVKLKNSDGTVEIKDGAVVTQFRRGEWYFTVIGIVELGTR